MTTKKRDFVLIDTSAWIQAIRKNGEREVRTRVEALLVENRAASNEMIWLELYRGAKGEKEIAHLEHLRKLVPLLELNEKVWQQSYQYAGSCRQKGLAVPASDILIAACAHYYNAMLEHCDKHFAMIEKVVRGKSIGG